MSSHLPLISGKDLLKILAKFGFYGVRSSGSHLIIKNMNFTPPITAVIPMHKELKIGTLKSILRQTGISEDDFLAEYHKS